MKKFLTLIVITTVLLVAAHVHATEIKLAIVAPEGSTWAKIVSEWNDELKAKTNGQVSFKIYAGGVQGDERDVIRKMKIGQLDAAGFTGLGLGIINPEVRVLELPFLFQNYKEVDAVTAKIQPTLKKGFSKKGFEFLGWAEAGFVNIFSNKPIASLKDLKGAKMWMWEADPLVKALCDEFGIVPIPLALADVLTSLQTNLIDAAYAPPLGAIAMQWFTRTKYYTKDKLTNSTGAFLITNRAMNKLTPAQQKILRQTALKYSKKLITKTRAENNQSYKALANAGLKPVDIEVSSIEEIRARSQKVWDKLAGQLYSPELLLEVKKTVKATRGK